MIPASYFFRDLYLRRFEPDTAAGAGPQTPPRHGRPDGRGMESLAAVLGLAPGAATFLLGPAPHGRRR